MQLKGLTPALGNISLPRFIGRGRREMSTAEVLKVGLFGGGVVGGGVYELVKKHTASGKFGKIGANIQITKICVRDLSKPRDFTCESGRVQFTSQVYSCFQPFLLLNPTLGTHHVRL